MREFIPSNENERLEAVHEMLANLPSGRDQLDEIVQLAAHVCGTPMAVLSLVDEESEHLIATAGFALDTCRRHGSFCAHTILQNRVLVVEDATVDAHFFDSELVTGSSRVRFYAGTPLITLEGLAVGTLSVLAGEAHSLEQWQCEALAVLARQAMAQLRLAQLEQDHAGALDDLEMARRNLSFLSRHDALTGLMNRAALTEIVDSLTKANDTGTVQTALLFIDIDNFKDINDSLGHEAGDRVLVTIGDRIHLGARGDDTVVRLAGDQYVVVIPNAASLAPETLARRLCAAISMPIEYQGAPISVTASIGVTRWGVHVSSPDQLLRSANAAMQYAKSEGRNRYVVFEDRVAHELSRRLDAHSFVRHVVSEGRLRLDFQPLWSLSNGAVVAHEALLRWDSPGAPTINPGEFVAAAEEIGLVGEITRFTIHEACRLAARRRDAGDAGAAVTVNLSSVQLDRDEVILVVATALNESGLDPSGLILELTESAKLAESGQGQATLRELQNMGVQIALDDFGTGFSSLALLRSFPFDFMKIDRSFVSIETEADREVLMSLVQLGHSLGMRVVAEGIEDTEVLDQLRRVGCDVAQGYLLGRPGPAEPPNNMAVHPLISDSLLGQPAPWSTVQQPADGMSHLGGV